MKFAALALGMAASLSAQSWEAGLFLGRQSHPSFGVAGTAPTEVKVEASTVMAFRLGYAPVERGAFRFQVSAVYQPRHTSDILVGGSAADGARLSHASSGLGAELCWKTIATFGLGLDLRKETLESTGAASTTWHRPWARASMGWDLARTRVTPFLRLEVAMPLAEKSVGPLGPDSDTEAHKSLAPRFQAGIQGGIRF